MSSEPNSPPSTNNEFRLRHSSAALENGATGSPNAALDAAADEIIASDPSLLALKASLSQKRALLLDQLAGMTPNHPLRKTTEEQLSEIETALQQMQANLRSHAAANLEQKLRTNLLRASTVEVNYFPIWSLIPSRQPMLHRAFNGPRSSRLKSPLFKRDTPLWMSGQETWSLKASHPARFICFRLARVPMGPLPSITRLILPLLLPFAALIAIGSVVLIDFFDRHIHNGIDVEQILGFSPIGSLFHDQDVSMQIFDEGTLRVAGGIDQAARTARRTYDRAYLSECRGRHHIDRREPGRYAG